MNARPLLATDRAALILQLVPYLIGKGEVTLAEAAEDFDVTVPQMRAMVEKLTVIGLPGDGGFWQMANDLFDIDWDLLDQQDVIVITNSVGLERTPRLSAREAAALLAGLQLAASLPGVGDSGVVQGLLAKLARGAATRPAEVIVAPEAVDDVRIAVAEAVRRGVAVSFGYRAPDAPETIRTVDPVKVHLTVPPGFGAVDDLVALHVDVLTADERERRRGWAVTTPLRTLVDAAASELSQEHVDRAVADALRLGLTTRRRLLRASADAPDRAALRLERALARVAADE